MTGHAFTPELKYELLKDIEKYPTIREGIEKGNSLDEAAAFRCKYNLGIGFNPITGFTQVCRKDTFIV